MNTAYKISPVDMAKRQNLDLKTGDTVRVFQKIKEKGKIRLQVFEGLVIAKKHGSEAGATFTVRKVASGVGMEKIFPLYSPNIDKIEITKRSRVNRSKLYFIRDKATKEIRKKMRSTMVVAAPVEVETNNEVVEEAAVAEEQVAE